MEEKNKLSKTQKDYISQCFSKIMLDNALEKLHSDGVLTDDTYHDVQLKINLRY